MYPKAMRVSVANEVVGDLAVFSTPCSQSLVSSFSRFASQASASCMLNSSSMSGYRNGEGDSAFSGSILVASSLKMWPLPWSWGGDLSVVGICGLTIGCGCVGSCCVAGVAQSSAVDWSTDARASRSSEGAWDPES